jgi:hypothetical protein
LSLPWAESFAAKAKCGILDRRRDPIHHGGGLGYSRASLVTSIEGVDKVAQWSETSVLRRRWNEFFYERTPPRQRSDVRVRVIHYAGCPLATDRQSRR